MPIPSVDPIPLADPSEFFFAVPDDAQDASYFAASARIASFSRTVCEAICSIYVLLKALPSPRRKKAPIS